MPALVAVIVRSGTRSVQDVDARPARAEVNLAAPDVDLIRRTTV